MRTSAAVLRSHAWLNLPLGLLLVILQRTPAVRLAAALVESMPVIRAGELLRAAASLAALGTVHSLAGATAYVQSPGNPVTGTVGTRVDVAFTYSGTPSPPARFAVSGTLPPGLSFVPAPVGGIVRSGTPIITGIPTQAGSFGVFVQGFNLDGLTNGVQEEIRFVIAGGVTATAPVITTGPQSQTVNAGAAVTFSVQATGTPVLAYQWSRNSTPITGATAAALTLAAAQVADAGGYAVVVANAAGTATSATATLIVNVVGPAPTVAITTQPASQAIVAGGTVAFNVAANGATGFQWRRNGTPITAATSATLVVRAASPADAGEYTVVASGGVGTVTSRAAQLTVAGGADTGRLINLSILTTVSPADPFFTLGTVVGGAGTDGSKPLLVRAAGPALAQLGVNGALNDPKLEVFSGAIVTASNDDWGGTAALASAFGQVGAFPYAAASSKDAASFNPATAAGAYTIQISGVGSAAGAVIAELYDASANGGVTTSTPRLVNVSVLKQIPAGGILTAGFVIGGGSGAAKTVLIRAIGPTLGVAPFNVGGAMADPKLELFSGQAVIAANDNWGGDAQLTAVGGSVGAFALANAASRDAILLVTLAPGSYTAQVSGVGGGGAALVEVYEVP
ncbi:immunoglobulin domain-containing protein [Horticoccus sp. 23ND18S-11]|uniref:immunoglobulin domain-containing protein n=1 Tax=Horticoccus sp. 23ND18S-11 TaxID=3391832 RepID=UPI0039C8EDC3